MGRVEKTVFISYRRTNMPWALAIYQNLTAYGYDVFFDYESIASGDFEQIILGNIRARAHFLVVLTPSALERCDNPDDWLRREIETALDEKRNIVPLFLEGFDFGSPAIAKHLTGKLANLKKYNGLVIPAGFFDEAMTRIREKFLNVALDAVIHPVSDTVQNATEKQKLAASKAKAVRQEQLSAQQWKENGNKSQNVDEKISCYTQAIRLDPNFADAYYNRGNARAIKGDLDGAIEDLTNAIRLKPDDTDAYGCRGVAYSSKGDYNNAIKDCNEAIRIRPKDANTYNNRGIVNVRKGDLSNAIRDFNEAIRLKPNAGYYYNRGNARLKQGDLDGAIKDYSEAAHLQPDMVDAYWGLGLAWDAKQEYFLAAVNYQKYFDRGGTDEGVQDLYRNARKKIPAFRKPRGL
jgi:tetratricopeptide (TPR) repeat protein